jgi:hypothetical protein
MSTNTEHDKLYNWLLYLTNNEKKAASEWRADEVKFDIGFFITMAIAAVLGFFLFSSAIIVYMRGNEKAAWCIVFGAWGIEYCVFGFINAWDSLRHNRED